MKRKELVKELIECLREYDLAMDNNDNLTAMDMVGRMWIILKILRRLIGKSK